MLTHIHIRDLATIQELSLQLNHGTTMITGETGAGKSVFIEAIELGLGGRASANMVRQQKEKAEITLSFDIEKFPKVIERLKTLELYDGQNDLILRRIITADGRSRCYINGTPANVQLIRELGELLFHLHSQHEQQVLLKSETQREILDRFADAIEIAQNVKSLAENCHDIDNQIAALRNQSKDRATRCEFLRFQLEELQTCAVDQSEWEKLEAEHHRLSHQEDFVLNVQAIKNLIQEDDKSVISTINLLKKNIDMMCAYEPKAKTWLEIIAQIQIHVNELYSEVKHAHDQVEVDPQLLQQLEQRIAQIFSLARKYKIKPGELKQLKNDIECELGNEQFSEENLEKLLAEQKALQETYQQQADQLSLLRKQAAQKFSQQINLIIRALSLPHGEFNIQFTPENHLFALNGQERIQFLIKTNPDQPLQALTKGISGGELSRLSLAAHLALAHRTTIPTLIFDEVDTGVSGGTAEKISNAFFI